VAPERGRRHEEMKAISGSLDLLTNIVLAWNTSRMHEVVDRLKRDFWTGLCAGTVLLLLQRDVPEFRRGSTVREVQ
jgi:hypothetical protein